MSYTDQITALRGELRALNKAIPATAAGFGGLAKAVTESGPLTKRELEFVGLGMAIVQRCEPCIMVHTEALMKCGATREELGSVLAMAIQMGGGPAMMHAAHALACWDTLAAASAA